MSYIPSGQPQPFLLNLGSFDPGSQLTESQIAKLVEDQMAYYFSRDNLIKDVHLRNMFSREDGTVPLAELIKFHKLKYLLGLDLPHLVRIVRNCTFLELFEDHEYVERSKIRIPDWEFWIHGMGPQSAV